MGKKLKFVAGLFTFCCVMFFSSTTAMAAQEETFTPASEVLIEEGYTEDGVYYEVYEVKPALSSKSSDVSIDSVISTEVARRVVYYAILPRSAVPNSIYWTESFDEYTTLTGYLYYSSIFWDYDAKTTDVWYKGTLTGRV